MTESALAEKPAPLEKFWVRTLLYAVSLVIYAALLFGPAGRIDWIAAWAYIALVVATLVSTKIIIERFNPEVLRWRRRMGKNTKRWDKVWLPIYRLLTIAVWVVAGLDAVRYQWTSMSLGLWPVGLALFLAGYGVTVWAMAVNPHFEGTVRIQTDRDHRVIDTGPYAFVRHPGYVGIILVTIGSAFLLGSWWALAPAAAQIPWVVVRTTLEDRTLQRELEGYAEFATRTRYRLLPGVW